ncbi:hypothetical protein KPH14_008391 [Odynerus spinipes]|uniref:CCHC-type domain-containing protein n=1 Tax=Odynerus spinipes TaxID=1348599 RepID=A0AAD9VT60_9HYME|nr:hypothetical protein KPH14_008391 [Odynerus spinipes]
MEFQVYTYTNKTLSRVGTVEVTRRVFTASPKCKHNGATDFRKQSSEYRSLQSKITLTNVPQATNQPGTVARSYASATANTSFLKKDQAIVIEAIEGTPIKEYISGISKLIKPQDIRFASRISNNRICVYFSSKKVVEEICKYKTIRIGINDLEVRPLITPSSRIIISNVCPVIPHDTIKEALITKGINLSSNISFLRAGFYEPELNHILSFRRQVYTKPDSLPLLPETMGIEYDGTKYWIYLSTESTTCFLCHKEGHIAKVCPNHNKQQDTNKLTTTNNNTESDTSNNIYYKPKENNEISEQNLRTHNNQEPPKELNSKYTENTTTEADILAAGIKRPLSPSSSSTLPPIMSITEKDSTNPNSEYSDDDNEFSGKETPATNHTLQSKN